MNYLVLSTIVIGASYFYERFKNTEKISKGVRWFFYAIICFMLCLFAGLRTKYNDTGAYIKQFQNTPNNFASLFSSDFFISEVYLFKIWNYVIYHFVSQNANVYLFFSSIVFVCPAIYLIEKYSKNFTFSIILFMFGGMYLFSLAGLKQAMATGLILIGLPHLFKRKYFKYYIYSILALGFHTYSIFFLLVPLLGDEIFNKRTILFCIGIIVIGVLLSYFSGAISAIIELLGKDISEETIQSGSVNILRAVVFLVPFVLTVLGRKNLGQATEAERWIVKIGMVSTVFMTLALFGNPILFGRIPQYFLIGIVVSLPLLIQNAFAKTERNLIASIAILCYVVYGLYALYVDGAFTRDIFRLIWF